jgi:hypothetical protein
MSGNFKNRNLLIIFLILAALFVVTRFTSKKRSDRTLKTDIVQIDTSQVTSILLYPRAEHGIGLEFSKAPASWTVTREGLSASADMRNVNSLLGELSGLQTEQLVARSRESWSGYQVDDSLGTRIVVKEGNKTTLDLVVGRFHFQPPPQNSYDPYRQNRGTGKSYVRLTGEEEVYSVEGFLAMSINQPFNRWRDQTITRINTSRLSRITFDYPADSGFVAQRNDAGWMVAGILADSASMETFVNGLSRKSHSEYANGFQPDAEPDYRATFEGDNMTTQIVQAYITGEDNLVLNSSLNPDSWFMITREDLFHDLFPGAEALISGVTP